MTAGGGKGAQAARAGPAMDGHDFGGGRWLGFCRFTQPACGCFYGQIAKLFGFCRCLATGCIPSGHVGRFVR